MPSCCVPGCRSRFFKKPNGIQFFAFPTRRLEQCELWSKAVGRENWKYTKWTKICSLHFTDKDFFPCPGTIRLLKRTAVPTQMMVTHCDSETENHQNNSLIEDEKPMIQPNSEKLRKILLGPIKPRKLQSNPQPIALIKVLHKVPNPIENGNRPNAETEQILPHDVSNPIVDVDSAEKSQNSNASPEINAEAIGITQEIRMGFDVPPPKAPMPIFIPKINTIPENPPPKSSKIPLTLGKIKFVRILPKKNCEPIADEPKTKPIVAPSNCANKIVGGKKIVVPIKTSSRKLSNGVNRLKKKSTIKILPLPISAVSANLKKSEPVKIIVHKVVKDMNNVPLKILPRPEPKPTIDDAKPVENCSKVNPPHHTMRILPFKDSGPILAVRCPLSNQEIYMPFPVQYLPKTMNEASGMIVKRDKNGDSVSINDDGEANEKSGQNRKTDESSQIEILKKEIIKLNQTIIRQKKRMQLIVHLRAARKEGTQNDEGSGGKI